MIKSFFTTTHPDRAAFETFAQEQITFHNQHRQYERHRDHLQKYQRPASRYGLAEVKELFTWLATTPDPRTSSYTQAGQPHLSLILDGSYGHAVALDCWQAIQSPHSDHLAQIRMALALYETEANPGQVRRAWNQTEPETRDQVNLTIHQAIMDQWHYWRAENPPIPESRMLMWLHARTLNDPQRSQRMMYVEKQLTPSQLAELRAL